MERPIKRCCKKHGITYADFAARVRTQTGTSTPTTGTIKLIASGHGDPGWKLIQAICRAFPGDLRPEDFSTHPQPEKAAS